MKRIFPALLLCLPTAALAEDSNFRVEFLLGNTTQSEDIDWFANIEGDATSYGIRGGYIVNQHLELELSYEDYGVAEDTVSAGGTTFDEELTTTAYKLGIKGILPINSQTSLTARFGMADWDYEFDEVDLNTSTTFSEGENGTDFYYGVGTQFQINEKIQLGFEYNILKMEVKIPSGLKYDREVNSLHISIGSTF